MNYAKLDRRRFLRIGAISAATAWGSRGQPRTFAGETKDFAPLRISPGQTIRVQHPQVGRVEGLPLIWHADQGLILARDGQLHECRPKEIPPASLSGAFAPFSVSDLRGVLTSEFSSSYEVKATATSLIVQPRGSGSSWPDAIDSLQRNFQREFSVRSIPLRAGHFPLVAIVYPDQSSFTHALSQAGHQASGNTLGIYSVLSNRMMLMNHGHSSGGVASTIRHEAAHQSAFNQGLHIRLADNPSWFVEGLGATFEANGFAEGARNDEAARKASWWRDVYTRQVNDPDLLAQSLTELFERDRLFEQNSDLGYAVSWALTSYLLERMPQAYAALAQTMNQLEPFKPYAAPRRKRDIERALQVDIQLLANNVHRWIGRSMS